MLGLNSIIAPKPLPIAWQADLLEHIVSIAWSADGQFLAIGTADGILDLYTATGQLAHNLDGHRFGLMAIDWHPHLQVMASAGQDGCAQIWDSQTGLSVARLEAGADWVQRVRWSPDGKYLATCAGKVLRLWSLDGKLVHDYPLASNTISDIAWSGNKLISTSYGGIWFYGTSSAEILRHFAWKGSSLVLAPSPNGKYIATGDQDSSVHFWMVENGKDLMMSGYERKVRELSWSSSSRYLATGGGRSIVVWDCSGKGPANTVPVMHEGYTDFVSAVAFSHSGLLLAGGGMDGRVGIWEGVKSAKIPLFASSVDSGLSALTWSPNDKYLAAASESGDLVVFGTG